MDDKSTTQPAPKPAPEPTAPAATRPGQPVKPPPRWQDMIEPERLWDPLRWFRH